MDNLTHSLFAATLARTRLSRLGRGTTAALLVASNAPDVDSVTVLHGGGVSYLHWHRGPTHGPLGIVGLGVASAAIVWAGRTLLDRRHGRADDGGNATFAGLALVSMLAVLLHILMDFPTSYGTRLLSPFDWHWYTNDLMPILDIYLIAVLTATLVIGRRSPEARRRNAAIALVFMAANYGARAVLHHQALAVAPRLFGAQLPALCDDRAARPGLVAEWPRNWNTTPPPGGGRCLVEIAAMPDFFSPFQWRLVAKFSGMYEVQQVNLLNPPEERPESAWRTVRRVPDRWTPDARRAANAAVAQVFLGFSRFPAVRTVPARGDQPTTVRWSDMRFGDGVPGRNQDPRAGGLFTATVRLDADGRVLSETLGP